MHYHFKIFITAYRDVLNRLIYHSCKFLVQNVFLLCRNVYYFSQISTLVYVRYSHCQHKIRIFDRRQCPVRKPRSWCSSFSLKSGYILEWSIPGSFQQSIFLQSFSFSRNLFLLVCFSIPQNDSGLGNDVRELLLASILALMTEDPC